MASYEDYSREELIRLLKDRDRRDATRFGLVWETNAVERERALNDDFVALDLDTALSTPLADGESADGWRNLIIEGDNFDALRFLRMAYAGRVKCICIDPPYNTGNRDFVYNDRFVDKDDAWRHSRWCEFMHQRLTLAKELLAEDGVIFVFIDDNEVHHLGLLMAQIFGEGNYVGNIIWQHSVQPKGYSGALSIHHNYLVAYSASGQFVLRNTEREEHHNANYRNPDNDPRGLWRAGDVRNALFRRNLIYDLITPSGNVIKPPPKGWRWSKETMAQKIATGEIVFRDDETRIIRKIYLDDQEGRPVESIWFGADVGTTREANQDLKAIFGPNLPFDTPKPTRVIERILQIGCGPDDIVLDFFAGSGTTAHAVLKQNAADGGNRRFILVSSTEATEDEPEKNLCREVCAERVRRVIGGYGEQAGLGGDFAYLKTRRIPEGSLTEIEHSQVWTALQLIHRERLTAYADAALHWVEDEDGALAYVPRVKQTTATEILKRAKSLPGVIVYTWQPGLLGPRLAKAGHIQVETIPQSLARKFGLGRSH